MMSSTPVPSTMGSSTGDDSASLAYFPLLGLPRELIELVFKYVGQNNSARYLSVSSVLYELLCPVVYRIASRKLVLLQPESRRTAILTKYGHHIRHLSVWSGTWGKGGNLNLLKHAPNVVFLDLHVHDRYCGPSLLILEKLRRVTVSFSTYTDVVGAGQLIDSIRRCREVEVVKFISEVSYERRIAPLPKLIPALATGHSPLNELKKIEISMGVIGSVHDHNVVQLAPWLTDLTVTAKFSECVADSLRKCFSPSLPHKEQLVFPRLQRLDTRVCCCNIMLDLPSSMLGGFSDWTPTKFPVLNDLILDTCGKACGAGDQSTLQPSQLAGVSLFSTTMASSNGLDLYTQHWPNITRLFIRDSLHMAQILDAVYPALPNLERLALKQATHRPAAEFMIDLSHISRMLRRLRWLYVDALAASIDYIEPKGKEKENIDDNETGYLFAHLQDVEIRTLKWMSFSALSTLLKCKSLRKMELAGTVGLKPPSDSHEPDSIVCSNGHLVVDNSPHVAILLSRIQSGLNELNLSCGIQGAHQREFIEAFLERCPRLLNLSVDRELWQEADGDSLILNYPSVRLTITNTFSIS
ncbi:hypothetical protein GQ42DRAFT_92571 [Ramicandelaber brevisporus]|nr:hypothetical protein GQ42DRAFT_92571 [Ramicandelaber brevisporus]